MSRAMNFQEIIMTMQRFWAEYGCVIWQPYYSQVGAGTMNPATFLRVLGPEPWKVAYVEPSIRPDDGRYGENPNRMQMHYQFQVILKPDPGNPQEVYLKSLQALGIDPLQHDIRFVEDKWEAPALGAWGLGWEVWLDGQEITQFTYFQQAGGMTLDPVSVEITYGLDRIAIALQQVDGFHDIGWDDRLTAGDINLQAEREHSKYYFEIADVERLRQMFDLFKAEAESAIEEGLILPAYDYLLKCSHTFNVLDTRGAVGVTERQASFAQMRELARRVSDSYLDQRESLEYPFIKKALNPEVVNRHQDVVDKNLEQPEELELSLDVEGEPTEPTDFLLEIGTEELPSRDLTSALEQLREQVPLYLEKWRLEHGNIRVMGTPRRLVVYVEGLQPRQSDSEQVIKGPPAERAFDAQGKATKAAEGFARSKGIDVGDLRIREINGGHYAVALVRTHGRSTPEVLAESLPDLLASLRFDMPMRWNESNVVFSRPIRWLLTICGDEQISFEYATLHSGNSTRGLRFHEAEEIQVRNPGDYFTKLESQGIVLDMFERRSQILAQVKRLASEVGGSLDDDPDLLTEVTNLVETPVALRGAYDAANLELPSEVLISVMKKHQRYFPVQKRSKETGKGKQLLPYFIAIRNGDGYGLERVVAGNEHVIRARFADAAFFVKEDLKNPLESFLVKLHTMTFQVQLGSMLDKTRRIQKLVQDLAVRLHLTPEDAHVAGRAAELCKADLPTNMVVEMTTLQGFMGSYYALKSGESEGVAKAIYEHYLPRFANDALPTTMAGLVVGIADRLDTLMGLFSVGLAPSGAKDPYAQRRTALGLVQNLIAWKLDFDINSALNLACEYLPLVGDESSKEACLRFIIERMRRLFLEQGYRYDVVDAVLAAQGENPYRASKAIEELSQWVARPDWHEILPAYSRCVRITRDVQETYAVSEKYLQEKSEKVLFSALQDAEGKPRAPGSIDDFLNAFTPLIPAINNFFDEVLVMSEDAQLRENRLGILQRISRLAAGVADMSKLEGF
jgi:glycyl-tRNA synthetase